MTRICRACGKGEVTHKKGTVEYNNISFDLPKDIKIPKCNYCGEQFINETLAEKIDEYLDIMLEE